MKKLVLAVFAVFTTAMAFAESPVKLSLFDDIYWPKTNSANVVLGLVDNNTNEVKGVDLNFISARADELTGVQLSWIYARSNKLRGLTHSLVTQTRDAIGVQTGALNLSGNVTGVEWGLINITEREVIGAQIGIVNLAERAQGLQWGIYNQAQDFSGLQLGIVNNITNIEKGLQIGLVNIIKVGGWFPGMLLVNGRF
jgi:hypothetical protein